MTRKHFEAIAAAMSNSHTFVNDKKTETQWWIDCRQLALTFEDFNPNFDRERFLAACKGE